MDRKQRFEVCLLIMEALKPLAKSYELIGKPETKSEKAALEFIQSARALLLAGHTQLDEL